MTWQKNKYIVNIRGGEGQVTTDPCRGYIQQLVVSPESSDTIWSMDILDRDNDCVYSTRDFEGQLNDRNGLCIGKDQMERFTVKFYELTRNENIKVIFNIEEKQ